MRKLCKLYEKQEIIHDITKLIKILMPITIEVCIIEMKRIFNSVIKLSKFIRTRLSNPLIRSNCKSVKLV